MFYSHDFGDKKVTGCDGKPRPEYPLVPRIGDGDGRHLQTPSPSFSFEEDDYNGHSTLPALSTFYDAGLPLYEGYGPSLDAFHQDVLVSSSELNASPPVGSDDELSTGGGP